MNLNHSDRAQVLVEALPYIQRYYGTTVVIKYGGNAMISEELRRAVISDIILLRLVGIHVVVVHGGGPEINELLQKTGKESRFVNGLRYTDEETMEAVQMVLCGKVNKNLVMTLNRAGGQAVTPHQVDKYKPERRHIKIKGFVTVVHHHGLESFILKFELHQFAHHGLGIDYQKSILCIGCCISNYWHDIRDLCCKYTHLRQNTAVAPQL